MRPPKGRTWAPRGHTPEVRVCVGGRGRVTVAGVVCFKPDHGSRLFYIRVMKRKLKKIQCRPHLIDGCLAETGLIIEPG